jgi:hypothetical protein
MSDDGSISLTERLAYALVGLISGGLLGLLVGGSVFYGRSRYHQHQVVDDGTSILILLGCIAGFAVVMAIWGFIGTSKMTDTLAGWWDQVTGGIGSR